MLAADSEVGDTPLRFFTQNTMPLYRLGLFSHNLWNTCALAYYRQIGNWRRVAEP